MEPFYFGKPSKLLFGNYHPPQGARIRDIGVVLCYPMGQEYIRSHRAFLQLAKLLSSNGFHVLRFDFYGCGDSEGNCNDGNINQWLADISIAVNELRSGCDVKHICLVGLRLGAAMSIIAGSKIDGVKGIIIWDPIVNGKQYLDELKHLHMQWLEGSFAKSQIRPKGKDYDEILGFVLTDSLKEELENLNLLKLRQKPADYILIVESRQVASNSLLKEHLDSIGVNLQYKHISSPKVWVKVKENDENSNGLVPIKILQFIVSWISERFS
jgi:alpha/beta superfamily hydrolase